jgi:hypothetical protein
MGSINNEDLIALEGGGLLFFILYVTHNSKRHESTDMYNKQKLVMFGVGGERANWSRGTERQAGLVRSATHAWCTASLVLTVHPEIFLKKKVTQAIAVQTGMKQSTDCSKQNQIGTSLP